MTLANRYSNNMLVRSHTMFVTIIRSWMTTHRGLVKKENTNSAGSVTAKSLKCCMNLHLLAHFNIVNPSLVNGALVQF